MPKNFTRKAYKIVVDIDKHELNKKRGLIVDYKIKENVKNILEGIEKIKFNNISKHEWLNKCFKMERKISNSSKRIL